MSPCQLFQSIFCPKCSADVSQTIYHALGQPGPRFCFNCGLNLLTFLTPLNVCCPKCRADVGHLFSSEAFYGPAPRYCVGCTSQITGRCANEKCDHDVTIFHRHCEYCGTVNPFYGGQVEQR